jgi:hypothetical protein
MGIRLGRRTAACVLGASTLAFGIVTASPGAAVAAPTGYGGTHTCTGTQSSPGELSGAYGNVVIDGWCNVDDGPVLVTGNLVVGQDATLNADFGLDNSGFTVDGNMLVGKNASVLMGCDTIFVTIWVFVDETAPNTVPSFPCFDDPNPNAPTLSSHEVIKGNLIADQALGVVLNNDTVGGSFIELGGGGDPTCAFSSQNVFGADVGFPVYSLIADSTVGGNVLVNGLNSCYWGMFRVNVGGNVANTNMTTTNVDSMEDVTNVIHGNFVCLNDTVAPQYGDSNGQPNKVGGLAIGQCGFGVTAPSPPPEADEPGVTPVILPISVPLH